MRHGGFGMQIEEKIIQFLFVESILIYICNLQYHSDFLPQHRMMGKQRRYPVVRVTIDLCKSHLVTIETLRNHSLSQHQIVFAIVEKYIGIVTNINFVPHRM